MRVGSALKVLAPSAGVLALFASTIAFGTSIGFAETASDWEPGPNAAGEYFCSGAIDSPNAGSVIASGASVEISGWIADMSATGWAGFDDLHVYDGTAGKGRLLPPRGGGVLLPELG